MAERRKRWKKEQHNVMMLQFNTGQNLMAFWFIGFWFLLILNVYDYDDEGGK